ncbi:secretion system protein, partial [Halobacteriales archaeon SW_7_68_16]
MIGATMSTDLPQHRLSVPDNVDEESFFSRGDGRRTLVRHSDLEAAVEDGVKPFLEERERYWVNKPYAFIVIYESRRESELRYYAVEPKLADVERRLVDFLKDKLRVSIDYHTVDSDATPAERAQVIRNETIELLKRYNLVAQETIEEQSGFGDRVKDALASVLEKRADQQAAKDESVDPVPVPRDDEGEPEKLDKEQVEKLIYYLVRDFIRYGRIDPLKQDINIEDISCDGYNSPVFVFHTEYENIVTNVEYGESDLDAFVNKLAQQAGKGISKRQPDIDATLPDGSRAQLTLGREISDKGTNFTIRQFKEVPFTPVDLINWQTFSLDQMAYLWLAIESGRSVVFAGGTASGKTTSLNAVSLFIPSASKIVSIEDTREVELPQRNWIANTTRPSFQEGGSGEIDEFDLLQNALRQRPDYVVMGEVRGEEGRTLFQMLNTGHTTYTTFHADSAEEVIRRFTTDPINVSKSLFTALDIVTVQRRVELGGKKVRRAISISEIQEYNASKNSFALSDVYSWEQATDTHRNEDRSGILDDIKTQNGWTDEELETELRRRRIVLSYLVDRGINTYAGVAATLQAYMRSPETVMALIANDDLEARVDNLRLMKNVEINVDPELEALVPRPTPDDPTRDRAEAVLDGASDIFGRYRGVDPDLARTLEDVTEAAKEAQEKAEER